MDKNWKINIWHCNNVYCITNLVALFKTKHPSYLIGKVETIASSETIKFFIEINLLGNMYKGIIKLKQMHILKIDNSAAAKLAHDLDYWKRIL